MIVSTVMDLNLNAWVSKEDVIEYEKKNPYPQSKVYPFDNFVNDITQSEGLYTLMEETEDEVIGWIEDCLNSLI